MFFTDCRPTISGTEYKAFDQAFHKIKGVLFRCQYNTIPDSRKLLWSRLLALLYDVDPTWLESKILTLITSQLLLQV